MPAYYKNIITRFVLRKNLLPRIRYRLRGYQRLLTKNLIDDMEFLLRGRDVNTIIDSGANIGFVTNEFEKRFPKADIYSFEPNPLVFEQLKQNYLGDRRVHTYQIGLADQCGELLFHVNANTGTSSFSTLQNTMPHIRREKSLRR